MSTNRNCLSPIEIQTPTMQGVFSDIHKYSNSSKKTISPNISPWQPPWWLGRSLPHPGCFSWQPGWSAARICIICIFIPWVLKPQSSNGSLRHLGKHYNHASGSNQCPGQLSRIKLVALVVWNHGLGEMAACAKVLNMFIILRRSGRSGLIYGRSLQTS